MGNKGIGAGNELINGGYLRASDNILEKGAEAILFTKYKNRYYVSRFGGNNVCRLFRYRLFLEGFGFDIFDSDRCSGSCGLYDINLDFGNKSDLVQEKSEELILQI